MVNRSDDTALNKEDPQSQQDKNMHQDKLANTTTVSYEDRDGIKYSYTNVHTFSGEEESNPDGPKFDAASRLPL